VTGRLKRTETQCRHIKYRSLLCFIWLNTALSLNCFFRQKEVCHIVICRFIVFMGCLAGHISLFWTDMIVYLIPDSSLPDSQIVSQLPPCNRGYRKIAFECQPAYFMQASTIPYPSTGLQCLRVSLQYPSVFWH